MASSVNKVVILGNLGKDPELKNSGEKAVVNFSVATSEQWTDKQSGEKKEKTEWHRVVVWGKLAELCGKYLSKGSKAYVEGRLQTREWTDKEGTKRYTTEVVAQQVVFLGSKGEGGGRRPEPDDPGEAPTSRGGQQADDDLPF